MNVGSLNKPLSRREEVNDNGGQCVSTSFSEVAAKAPPGEPVTKVRTYNVVRAEGQEH